ncbi:MerR family transcriptional regulator [Nocardioides lianchengensis]|uniref:DNA-binding transcriptional regulator, MerR family n=1 Tax=Nocardioides lianchengensis TaxID=1045774 RepID=A0A1G6IT04_9ACTN|nr:MerR family transcriptional regulator [Nocardioides lianchengensis]NYG12969.1 DNA-binding transcriptional MerR regulator [Nocardioides lianchengensis]SDC08896.1 DNA-binding transcriptional regulator, MerR family [Nocardioides lianchengensis]
MTTSPTGLLTVDELAAAAGMTVRTTRYYASLGLLPPPERRGRIAYYGPLHEAYLELVRALQDHGFTLQAVERYVASLPAGATVEDLALQRAMLTSWTSEPPREVTRAGLEEEAGRRLSATDLDLLVRLGALERQGRGYRALPNLRIGLDLLELDIAPEGVAAAGEAIARHMDALAEELTQILRAEVLAPYREGHTPEEAARLEQTLPRLRQLTLEALVARFQGAANAVITRSLAR